MIDGECIGSLNIERFFETLAKVVGEQKKVTITVTSIRKKKGEEPLPSCANTNAKAL